MKFTEIFSGIKELGVYSPGEWNEYASYFLNSSEGNDPHAQLVGSSTLRTRIKTMKGAEPVAPDYSISPKIVHVSFFKEPDNRHGATLGVVSGCFDLLHLGHLRSMAYAKQFLEQYASPRLCAMTLSDENIRMKKGSARPILGLNERLEVLSNVACIDYIIALEDPNCLAALDVLKPDYFFKAQADRSQEIVRRELELVESYGGSVVIFPSSGERRLSTTGIIQTSLKRYGSGCDGI